MSTLSADRLRTRLGDRARTIESVSDAGEEGVRVSLAASAMRELIDGLREEEDGRRLELVDLTVVDHRPCEPPRLEVVYRLESHAPRAVVRVHAEFEAEALDPDGEAPKIESVVSVWPVANWLEREAREFFGVEFRGHPEPAALLLDASTSPPPLSRKGGGA